MHIGDLGFGVQTLVAQFSDKYKKFLCLEFTFYFLPSLDFSQYLFKLWGILLDSRTIDHKVVEMNMAF